LQLDGVGKRYGLRLPWVVREVNLEIRPGGLVRLEGRNGSGKSTLLRVIAGVSAPSRGSVSGRPPTGFVPERFPPVLPFPAREYLAHIGRVHGLTGADLTTRIQLTLDRLGGWEFVDVPLRNMSKGMCQKVAVAQALLPGAGLLVLDEAWTGLDVEAKAALDEVVAERLAEGGSVVYVDHDPRRLEQLDAERWRIEQGRAKPVAGHSGGGEDAGQDEASAAGVAAVVADVVAEVAADAAAEVVAVVIEVDGYPAGSAAPDDLPGVLSAIRDGVRLTVRAEPDLSDGVLRGLLEAGDGVHVVGVRKEGASQ
jgi:ABC-2 type transport system ATP-binding protein